MRTVALLERLLDRILSVVTVALTVAMVALVVAAVVMRYVFGAPLIYSYDLSTLIFAWIVFVGLAVAEHDRAHLAVDAIDGLASPRARAGLVVVRQVGMAALSLFVAVIGWSLFSRAGMIMPSLRVSIGWLYASLPIGFALLALAQLLAIPRIVRAGSGERP